MVHQGSKYHSSFLALVSNMKEADVDVLNVERRLAPWFEYSHRRAAESGGKTATLSLDNIFEATRGGFRNTESLLFDALFFAWANRMSLAVQQDYFSERAGWKLSTTQFARAVEALGFEELLLVKLGRIPPHMARHLMAELDEIHSELHLHKSNRDLELRGKVSKDRFQSGSSAVRGLSAEATLCKRAIRMWVHAVSDSSAIKHVTRRALVECEECGQMTGALLLSSDRFQTARISFRDVDQKDSTGRELISILNRITGDTRVANPHQSKDDTIMVNDLWNRLYMDPEGFLTHLLSVARKHSSQAPTVLAAVSHLPGLLAYRLQPKKPALILTALSRIFRKSTSESSDVSRVIPSHKADGLNRIALWLTQTQRASLMTASPDIFGSALGTPIRAAMDSREALLTTVLPALLSSSVSSYHGLEMLYSVLFACDVIKDGDPKLSQRGMKLLQATFPGGILLALASCLESRNTDARLDLSPVHHGPSIRNFHERSRDLAASLLRSCVDELADQHSQLSAPVLRSLVDCDEIAPAKASWQVRLLLEPILQKVRENPSTSTKVKASESHGLSDDGLLGATQRHSSVLQLAKALADLIKLNQLRVFETQNFQEWLMNGTGAKAQKEDRGKMRVISRKIDILRSTRTVGEFRSALLVACAATIPYVSAKEMDSLFHGFLAELVVHISIQKERARDNSALMIIDLLSRVLSLKVEEMNGDIIRPTRDLEIEAVSRHLATTAVESYTKLISNKHDKGTAAAKRLRILRSLQAALIQVVSISNRIPMSPKPISILVNACLRLMGELKLEGLGKELVDMFRDFPEHECKQRIMRVCYVRL
jgi:hypothetical protein